MKGSTEDKSLLISALNSQHSFQSLDLLISLSKIPVFSSLPFPEKNSLFQSEARKSRFQVYKNYDLPSFLKDLSCEIAMAIRKTRALNFDDQAWHLAGFFSLFFELKEWNWTEKGTFSFEIVKKTGLFPYFEAILRESETFLREEVFEVAVQVHNLSGEVLGYIGEFEALLKEIPLSEENRQDFIECQRILEAIFLLFYREPGLRSLADGILRDNGHDFWVVLDGGFGEAAAEVLEYALAREKNSQSLILGYLLQKEQVGRLVRAVNFEGPTVRIIDILLELAGYKPSILLNVQEILLGERVFREPDDGLFNMILEKLVKIAQKLTIENPSVVDFLLGLLEKAIFSNFNRPTFVSGMQTAIFPMIFSQICQNEGFLNKIIQIDPSFFRRIIKTTEKADKNSLPLIFSILTFAFTISTERFLLTTEDFESLLLVSRTITEDPHRSGLLIAAAEHIMEDRGFRLTHEKLLLLLEEIEKARRHSTVLFPISTLDSLVKILIKTLKAEPRLYFELRKNKGFNYLLRIDECGSGFSKLRVLLLKFEVELVGTQSLRKLLEEMFANVRPGNCGFPMNLVVEIENFNGLEVLLNVVLTIRKLVRTKEFRGLMKDLKVVEGFLRSFAGLCERAMFLREWLAVLEALVGKHEYLQYFLTKTRFLRKKVHKQADEYGLMEDELVRKAVLSLGMGIEKEKGINRFFEERGVEGMSMSDRMKGVVMRKTTGQCFWRNLILIHENLGIFLDKGFKKLKQQEKSDFMREFFVLYGDERLGVLGTSLFSKILPILQENAALYLENLRRIFEVLRLNQFQLSGSSSGPAFLSFLIYSLSINEEIPLTLFLNEISSSLFQNTLPSCLPYTHAKVLFLPDTSLKTMDFSLMFWIFIPNTPSNPLFSLLTLLNFTRFRPELTVAINGIDGLAVEYSGLRVSLDLPLPFGQWVFFGMVSNCLKNELKLSFFLNGALKASQTLPLDSPMTPSQQFDLLIGDPSPLEPTNPFKFMMGPLLMLRGCLNNKEMAIFYLLNSNTGVINLENNRPMLNLRLLNKDHLNLLELHIKQAKKNTRKTTVLRCFMPDFGSRTLVHINPKADFESSKGNFEELKNRKTLDFLNNIEKHSVFKVFLKIKRLLAENIRKNVFLTVKNKENQGFLLGFDDKEDVAFFGIWTEQRRVWEALEEGDFVEKSLILIEKTENLMIFKEKLRFFIKIIEKNDVFLDKFEENIGAFKEILRKKAAEITNDELEMLYDLAVRRVDDGIEFIYRPEIFRQLFLSIDFFEIVGKNANIFYFIRKLMKKNQFFENINLPFIKNQDAVFLVLDALILVDLSQEAMRLGFEILLELFNDITLLKYCIDLLSDLLFPSMTSKIFSEKILEFESNLLPILLQVLKSNSRQSTQYLDTDFFLLFFKGLPEKLNSSLQKPSNFIMKPLISCFLLSFFQQNDLNPLRIDYYTKELIGFSCFGDFYSLGLAFLLKTEAFNEKISTFSIENSEKMRFSFLFRVILEAVEYLYRIMVFLSEKDKIIDFLEENPGFLMKNDSFSKIYDIFKPKNEEFVPKIPEKHCENAKNAIFSLLLGETQPDFSEKMIIDFLNNRDFQLVSLPKLSELGNYLDCFLSIFLNNQHQFSKEFDVLLGKLAKNLDFLMKSSQNPLIFRLNSKIIDIFHNKFLNFTEKTRLSVELLPIKLVFSDTQFEAFSLKALESLADRDLGSDEFFMNFLRKTLENYLLSHPGIDFLWILNIIFIKLRKITENYKLLPRKTKTGLLGIFSSNSEENNKNRQFLTGKLGEWLPSLIFRNLVLSNGSEELLEKALNLLIFNSDLLFSEKNIPNFADFINALIFILYDMIFKFSSKIAEKSIIILSMIPFPYLKSATIFGDFDCFSNGLELLSKLRSNNTPSNNNNEYSPMDFLNFLQTNNKIRELIDLVVYKKLQLYHQNYLNDQSLFKCEEERLETENGEYMTASRKSSFTVSPLIRKPTQPSINSKLTSLLTPPEGLTLSRNNTITGTNNPSSDPPVFKEKLWDLSDRLEKLRFSELRNSKSLIALRKALNLNNFSNGSREIPFVFKQANRVGYGYKKSLLFSIETPEDLMLPLTSSSQKPPHKTSSNSSQELGLEPLFIQNNEKNNENIAKTGFSEEFIARSASLAQKSDILNENIHKNEEITRQNSEFAVRYSKVGDQLPHAQKSLSKLSKILDLFNIHCEIRDYFHVALLKSTVLTDSLLLLTPSSLILISNCLFLSPESTFVSQTSSPDSSKWFLPRPPGFNSFVPIPKSNAHCFSISLVDLIELHAKRYLLFPSGIEIYHGRKSLFLVTNITERDVIIQKLLCLPSNPRLALTGTNAIFIQKPSNDRKKPIFELMTQDSLLSLIVPLWETGVVSSFSYIQFLNLVSGRTYSDLSQYPVFPWVLSDYTSPNLSIDNPKLFRDLSKPIGALTPEKVLSVKERFAYTNQEALFPAFHHGSHYSSQTLVFYYLLRLLPYSLLARELQGGKFDLSDRLFDSIVESWELAVLHDVKELLPELFYLDSALVNINSLDFGLRQSNVAVGDLKLAVWSAQNPRVFALLMNKALESVNGLNLWIDLIWGFKQRGKGAIDSLNRYFFLTYEGGLRGLEKFSISERNGFLQQINEYGQTPKQLFGGAHGERKKKGRSVGFYWAKERLGMMTPEIFAEIRNDKAGFGIVFKENKGKMGGFSTFAKVFDGLLPTNTDFSEENMVILHEKQCILQLKSPWETEILDSSSSSKIVLIRNNRVFQCFEFSNDHNNNVSIITTIPESEILVIGGSGGCLSFYKIQRNDQKRDFMNIGFIFEGKTGVFSNEMEDFDKIPLKNRNFNNKNGSSPRLRRFNTMKQAPSKDPDFPIKKKSLIREKTLLELQSPEEKTEGFGFYNFKLITRLSGYHKRKVTILQVSKSFGVLISCDETGVICLWDYFKPKFIRSIRTRHFLYSNHYYSLLIPNKDSKNHSNENKEREKIRFVNVLDENGDFCLVSKSYLSLYDLNGVLLACERKEKAHFSCCKLLSNPNSIEEDYFLTGDYLGGVRLWVLRILDRPMTGEYYREHMINSGNYPGKTGFGLECVWEGNINNNNVKRNFEVLGLGVSGDQRKMISWHRNGEVYEWRIMGEEEEGRKCGDCRGGFGILEKKGACGWCGRVLCGNCGKNEVIVAEISLKKAVKLCGECLKMWQNRKILQIYDNY